MDGDRFKKHFVFKPRKKLIRGRAYFCKSIEMFNLVFNMLNIWKSAPGMAKRCKIWQMISNACKNRVNISEFGATTFSARLRNISGKTVVAGEVPTTSCPRRGPLTAVHQRNLSSCSGGELLQALLLNRDPSCKKVRNNVAPGISNGNKNLFFLWRVPLRGWAAAPRHPPREPGGVRGGRQPPPGRIWRKTKKMPAKAKTTSRCEWSRCFSIPPRLKHPPKACPPAPEVARLKPDPPGCGTVHISFDLGFGVNESLLCRPLPL